MVAGAAVLLVQQFPDRIPAEIKSLLMNTAETNILDQSSYPAGRAGADHAYRRRRGARRPRVRQHHARPGMPTPGPAACRSASMRVDEPHDADQASRWCATTAVSAAPTPSGRSSATRTTGQRRGYRHGAARGRGRANGQANFPVRLRIDPTKLPAWNLNGGANGGNGRALQGVEFDGYLNLTPSDNIHLAVAGAAAQSVRCDARPQRGPDRRSRQPYAQQQRAA